MKRINIRMTDDQADDFSRYLDDNEITESEAGRIAIDRLLAAKPKPKEREAAKLDRGNPNFRKPEHESLTQTGEIT